MTNRAGLRSPASAASRMRVPNNVLLDCACSSGDNELHAKSSATCMLLTVSGAEVPTFSGHERPQGTMWVSNVTKKGPSASVRYPTNGAGFLHREIVESDPSPMDISQCN